MPILRKASVPILLLRSNEYSNRTNVEDERSRIWGCAFQGNDAPRKLNLLVLDGCMQKMAKMPTTSVELSSEINPSPVRTAATQILDTSKPGSSQVLRYRIEVKSQGSYVAEHVVEATDALTAINIVECRYGEPAKVETVLFEDEHGTLHHVVVVKDWHGFTFNARAIEPMDAVGY